MIKTAPTPADPKMRVSPVDNRLWRVYGDAPEPNQAPLLLGFIERTADAYRVIRPGSTSPSGRESLELAQADFLSMA
ncbi:MULTISPECIES: hypothetical protein [unclassified Salinibacterium]|uniref:hypothetical protein n=1 Tax=unclassified Salinibacterium TaxID=2632331 RepID=UPI0014247B64|nr:MULTISPECIES: hypothetical protein [unclassified Salinibacterium]